MCLVACRPKDKPTPLALIPEDAPVIAWLPEPRASIEQLKSYLAVFERENLGDQFKAIRLDWLKQVGIDPLDPTTMEGMGLDLQKPWALSYDAALKTPVALLAAKDPDRFIDRFSKMVKESQLLEAPRVLGSGKGRVLVYEQPFGNTQLEQFAIRVIDHTVLITSGEGGAAALSAWPVAYDQPDGKRSFQKVWKKSESDGSMGGAALRIVAKDTKRLLPASLHEALGSAGPQNPKSKVITATEPEIRCALTFKEHRAEMFVALLGASPQVIDKMFASETTRPAGAGLPDDAVLVARSTLDAPRLYTAATEVKAFVPVVRFIETQFGGDTVQRLIALSTGAAALALQMKPLPQDYRVGRGSWDRAKAVLDMFPITATAELKDGAAFDRELITLSETLASRRIPATLERGAAGYSLKATTVGDSTTLSRDGSWLTYAVGPGAYPSLRARLQAKQGIDTKNARFGFLFEPRVSGVVMDVGAIVHGAGGLPEILLGEQNALASRFFGRAMKSFEHFDTAGAVLTLEGPALGLHPVARFWLSTK